MKRILVTATVVRGHIMQFHLPVLKMFKEMGWEVSVAARNDYEDPSACHIPYCDHYYDIPFERSPFSPGNAAAYRELKQLVDRTAFDIVHCHTPVGGVLTRIACRKCRKAGTRVFYTAHGFHFYKGAPLLNWLLYYPTEKLCSYLTDVLITINKEDYALAQRKMKAKRIEYIPGVGIDVAKFRDAVVDRNAKRQELGIPQDAFVLMSVGELNRNKNHEIVIRALAQLQHPQIHYAIAGEGELREYLPSVATELGLEDRVHFLGYRRDIAELYYAADVCVFPSIREGLGMAALEGMATGLPLIASDNRGTNAYAVHNENAVLCAWDSLEDFAKAISALINDESMRQAMGAKNRIIVERYNQITILQEIKKIYSM